MRPIQYITFGFFTLALSLFSLSRVSQASDLKTCLARDFITQDLAGIINESVVPDLPEQIISAAKSTKGKDPAASVAPIQVQLGSSPLHSNDAVLRITFPEIKYSARFGDTALFRGPRIGVRGSAIIEGRLDLNSDYSTLILNGVKVQTAFHAELGGALGHIIAEILTSLGSAFGASGKISKKLQTTLEGMKIMPTLLTQKPLNGRLKLEIESVTFEHERVCLNVNLVTVNNP